MSKNNKKVFTLYEQAYEDGVTYFSDLKETKETITDEINDYSENN